MTKKILKGKVIREKNSKTVVLMLKRKYSNPFLPMQISFAFSFPMELIILSLSLSLSSNSCTFLEYF